VAAALFQKGGGAGSEEVSLPQLPCKNEFTVDFQTKTQDFTFYYIGAVS
jgi:hypothetical protein